MHTFMSARPSACETLDLLQIAVRKRCGDPPRGVAFADAGHPAPSWGGREMKMRMLFAVLFLLSAGAGLLGLNLETEQDCEEKKEGLHRSRF